MFFIDEIFSSINGETLRIGEPTTFIRLKGCNLKCSYCDTVEQRHTKMSLEDIIQEVINLDVKSVCITGGEPMLHHRTRELAHKLWAIGFDVYIETNGSIELEERGTYRYIMDIKCPSSDMEEHNLYRNLAKLNSRDEVKFVIADRNDFDFALKVLNEFPTKATVLFSPMFEGNKIKEEALGIVDWCLQSIIPNYWRIQVQIHKLLQAR